MDETEKLAAFTATASYDDLPSDVVDRSKAAIRDYLGVAIYGSHHEVGERIIAHVDACNPGNAATVLGRGQASVTGAALANGTFGHAIDYDDTFESIVIHPTSPIFAAALAATETSNADGRALLTGYAVGVETAYRVGHSTYPGHYQNGWHSTGTIGAIGAATAASSVFSFDKETTRQALGIVASGSSALKKNFGTMTKPLHAGHAAEMGVRAALLARDGFTGDSEILDGKLGYGNVMTPIGEYTPEDITEELGTEWNVTDLGFKPYPSGVITHAAMEGMRTLVLENALEPNDVETVRVALDEAASEMLHHKNPKDGLQAKFSIEFCLAAILREGDAGVHEFTDEYVQEPETRNLIAKIEREFEENLLGGDFAGYGARVTVITTDGDEIVETVKYAPGSPSNPVSDDRLEEKFFECAETVLDREDADLVSTAVENFEESGSIDDLLTAASN